MRAGVEVVGVPVAIEVTFRWCQFNGLMTCRIILKGTACEHLRPKTGRTE
jgi:hypothetical protein